jgi:membrane protease YdiL (CAAX protease family)
MYEDISQKVSVREEPGSPRPGFLKRNSLAAYFVLAYGITWILSIMATKGLFPFQLPAAIMTFSSILLHYGPALAAIIVAGIVGRRAGVQELLSRLREWRVGVHWYLFILLYPTIARLIAVGLNVLLGGTAPAFFGARGIPEGNPIILFIPVFVGLLLQAGIAEEIGWRGFALPRLQAHYSALTSSLILGVLWALWHFHPLHWSDLAPIAFWYILGTLSLTVIFTWVYNNTRGSLLVAVLFHTASNTSDWIVPIVPFITGASDVRASVLLQVFNLIVAVAIIVVFGSKHLSRRPPSQGK